MPRNLRFIVSAVSLAAATAFWPGAVRARDRLIGAAFTPASSAASAARRRHNLNAFRYRLK